MFFLFLSVADSVRRWIIVAGRQQNSLKVYAVPQLVFALLSLTMSLKNSPRVCSASAEYLVWTGPKDDFRRSSPYSLSAFYIVAASLKCGGESCSRGEKQTVFVLRAVEREVESKSVSDNKTKKDCRNIQIYLFLSFFVADHLSDATSLTPSDVISSKPYWLWK